MEQPEEIALLAERPEQFELVLPGDARKILVCRGAVKEWEKMTFQELEQRAGQGCPLCAIRIDIMQECVKPCDYGTGELM
jgi:hypothetical protein